jgi:glycosyltransferase involved in cell wall biosynthesis
METKGLVCFISAADSPWGAEHSLRAIAGGLRELGHECRALVSSPAVAEFLEPAFLSLPHSVEARGNRLLRLWRLYQALRQLPQGASVVLFSLQLVPIAALLRTLSRGRYNVVLDLHDVPQDRFDKIAVWMSSPFLHRTIAISQYVKESVAIVGDVVVVPRPVDEASYRASHDSNQFHIGIVGRLDREKRIDVAIRAVAECDSRMILHVYGSPMIDGAEYVSELRDLADQVAPGRVQFHGTQPKSAVYKNLDVLLVTNDLEPSGRSVGEAMMAGVVALVPDDGGASEFFVNGESGLTYKSGDSEDAGRVLQSLANRELDLGLMNDNARRHIRATRSVDRVAIDYSQALMRRRALKGTR